jgi:hypothetical protein
VNNKQVLATIVGIVAAFVVYYVKFIVPIAKMK